MSRLSSKNYNPRVTGSLRHFMLIMFRANLKPALFSTNSSTSSWTQAAAEFHVRFCCVHLRWFTEPHAQGIISMLNARREGCLRLFIFRWKQFKARVSRALVRVRDTTTTAETNSCCQMEGEQLDLQSIGSSPDLQRWLVRAHQIQWSELGIWTWDISLTP